MRGGIQEKGNNYYAVVYDGIDPGTGKKRRTWIPAGPRRADAVLAPSEAAICDTDARMQARTADEVEAA